MYLVVETDANRKDPEAYGRLRRPVAACESVRAAWDRVCSELGAHHSEVKSILTTGVTGYTNLPNVQQDIEEDGRAQLFTEFSSVVRYWIVDVGEL